MTDTAGSPGPGTEQGDGDGAVDPGTADVSEELVSRLQVIEEQPLGERAAAFALLHDQLRTRLEGGDGADGRG